MEKKTIKTKFLAGALAAMLAGNSVPVLAKGENTQENNISIVQSIEETDNIGLSEEFLNYLNDKGVKVIDGDMQIESVDDFLAVTEYYHQYVNSLGFEFDQLTINDTFYCLNFTSFSDEFKQELLTNKAIRKEEKPFHVFYDSYNLKYSAMTHIDYIDKMERDKEFNLSKMQNITELFDSLRLLTIYNNDRVIISNILNYNEEVYNAFLNNDIQKQDELYTNLVSFFGAKEEMFGKKIDNVTYTGLILMGTGFLTGNQYKFLLDENCSALFVQPFVVVHDLSIPYYEQYCDLYPKADKVLSK